MEVIHSLCLRLRVKPAVRFVATFWAGMVCLAHDVFPIDEKDGTEDAEKCPEVIHLPAFAHEVDGEGYEDADGNGFLCDFELSQVHAAGDAETVGRDDQAVFKEGDRPTQQDDDEKRFVAEK